MFTSKKNTLIGCLIASAYLISIPMANAQEEPTPVSREAEKIIAPETWNAKFQSTYIWQRKQSFDAPYSGTNSLSPEREKAYSLTATGYFGLRLWGGAELYFNPEMVQAVPLSGLHGLGGMTNSEQQKTSGPNPKFYRARLFLRQTFDFGGARDAVESGPNQLAGMVDKRRLVVTLGNVSVTDIFDNNAYAHDARTQFVNWSFLTYGAYDYAGDARGYTWGGAAEYYYDDWAIRYGRFMVPIMSNGQPLETRLAKYYGDQIEIERGYALGNQVGKVRFLVFRNKENMGSFSDAIAADNGGIPSVAAVRKDSFKVGYGFSLEHALRSDIGLFARASRNDGKTETYSFTEIERSVTAGVAIKGEQWGRSKDTIGVAVAQNGLSKAHQDYLSLGGLGAFIGDGKLHYKPEKILEAYYNIHLYKDTYLMFDAQRITNPAYNADRGPVNVGTIRLHAEF
ncbi:carbohydrate porin [Glaciimonas sp. GNP009]